MNHGTKVIFQIVLKKAVAADFLATANSWFNVMMSNKAMSATTKIDVKSTPYTFTEWNNIEIVKRKKKEDGSYHSEMYINGAMVGELAAEENPDLYILKLVFDKPADVKQL